jgi:dephospho-CoA kinase
VRAAVPVVGLTGGIGAGKSTALEALRRLGAAVLSTDAVVHELYLQPDVRDAVVGRWGPQVAPAGVADREQVARHAFADEEERRWLEGLIWPRVGARVTAWLAGLKELPGPAAPRAAVIEVPLLFEAGLADGYDATIAVVSAEPLRRLRAERRGHALLDERAARQLSQDEKARRATFVVRNDGSEEDLERELSAVLDKLGR